jgi:PTH1 family peptidyl-tRNA hydrolase
MKLVVGLGNPGSKYEGTRHNAGFDVLRELLRRVGQTTRNKFQGEFAKGVLANQSVGLLLPQTYMNRSGDAVRPAVDFFGVDPTDVIVVHDELDLALGRIKVKQGGGHGGHNGLRSIASHIGSDFVRVRCGIGRPPGGNVTNYVLGRFSGEDREWASQMTDLGSDAVEEIVRSGIVAAMNKYNVAQ